MTASVLFGQTMGINYTNLSKEESLLLEVNLFAQICTELKEIYIQLHKNYFQALRFNLEMEETFMETNFIRHIIQDILSTEEYSLMGLAYYTNIPEDVLYDIAVGKNTDPAASILRKIIDLHRTIRPELYQKIMQKLISNDISSRAA